MSGVLDALASQIGASVEATIFLLSLFIGKANLCLCQNRCHETNRISYVIIHYAVLQCSCVFLKLKLGPVCNRQNFKFLYYCMNIVRTLMNLYKSNIFCFYLINYWNEIFFYRISFRIFPSCLYTWKRWKHSPCVLHSNRSCCLLF